MNTKDIKCYIDDEEVDCSTWISCDENDTYSPPLLLEELNETEIFRRETQFMG